MCKQEPTFANVHCLADLSSVRYKTSTWNEIKELIKSSYLIVPSLLNNKSEKYDMEWSVGDEAIFRRTRNCTLERNWNEQPQSSSVFLTLLNVSPEFEQEVVFYFLSHSCMYSAVRNHVRKHEFENVCELKLDKVTLFTHFVVGWNLEHLYKQDVFFFFSLKLTFQARKSVFWKVSFAKQNWLRVQDFVYKTLGLVRISVLISTIKKSFWVFSR